MTTKKTEKDLKEIEYGIKIQIAALKNEYITSLINGRYFLARSNMVAEQLQTKIVEKIDGALKTEEYFRCEYALIKMSAINGLRKAHFAKLDLMNKFKLTKEDISKIEEDYYNGKIIREDYDEPVKRQGKAKFVKG